MLALRKVSGKALRVSAILAVLYALIMFASLMMVGLMTTGSWRAAFLGIHWNTVAGFEIGLASVVSVSLAIAGAVAVVLDAVRRTPLKAVEGPRGTGIPFVRPRRSRAGRLLIVIALSGPIGLVGIRAIAFVSPQSVARGPDDSPMNLGTSINTAFREAEPSFTSDGRTMYFNCNNGDICVSHLLGAWETASWTPPERLSDPINTEFEEVEPVINGAGDRLYFTSIRPWGVVTRVPFLSPYLDVLQVVNTITTRSADRVVLGGLGTEDIYVSDWVDGAWTEPRNLNDVPGEPPINTAFDDHCLFFSADGKEAFWTSTRPGGYGGNDIWTSRLVNGQWTAPENLGPNINSSGEEHHSIPAPDGQLLYVTATRRGGYGGEDIFVAARMVDSRWGPLANLGRPVNGPGDDRCPVWTPDLRFFLFDSVREGGFGGRDIWWLPFKEVMGHPLASEGAGS